MKLHTLVNVMKFKDAVPKYMIDNGQYYNAECVHSERLGPFNIDGRYLNSVKSDDTIGENILVFPGYKHGKLRVDNYEI